MKFLVVAEKPLGLFRGGERVSNPFLIRNIFASDLRAPTERRTWDSIEARNEKDLRRLFNEAVKTVPGMAGFVITKIEPLAPTPERGTTDEEE